jgi:hypothetical protein
VTVAVTAVPLELTVIKVCPALLVAMPRNVACVPAPTVVDKPGERVSVVDSRVMMPPVASVGWAEAAPGVWGACVGSLPWTSPTPVANES